MEYTPGETTVGVAPVTVGADPGHGDSKTASPPISDTRVMGPTVPLASMAPDTRNAPYARSVVNEAAPRAVAFHTGKNRIRPPWL